MNCTVCGKWFETTACPGPHTYVINPSLGPPTIIEPMDVEVVRLRAEVDALAARAEAAERSYKTEQEFTNDYIRHLHKAEAERDALAARVRELEGFARGVFIAIPQLPVRHPWLDQTCERARALLAGDGRATEPETGTKS